MRVAGSVLERMWLMLGLKGDPPLNRFAAALVTTEGLLKIDRAKNELGYAPVMTIERGLGEMAGA